MTDHDEPTGKTETEAELEARYFAGYQAFPDDDEDFKGVERAGIEMLRRSESRDP